jgi:hypothetical protein
MPKSTRVAAGTAAFMVSWILAASMLAGAPVDRDSWLRDVFEKGRTVFYETIKTLSERNPGFKNLSPGEREKIGRVESIYPRIYGLSLNYFYQKDEPVFAALIKDGGDAARRRFQDMYLDLARFCGRLISDSYFLTNGRSQYFRGMMPAFKGKDVVDLVAMSTSQFANLKTPEKPGPPRTLSPEFERQWGLDAAKFRAAHRITRGKGVRIAVMDSGIDPTHPVFAKTRWGRHVNLVGRDAPPWSGQEPPMVDWGWHGTLVSSIVAVYAPEATITVYRYIDADTQNNPPYPLFLSSLMGAGIYKAVHDGNDIINISAGTGTAAPYLKEACQYAYDHNVIVVAGGPYSVGMYLGEDMNFPGQYPTTMSITGADRIGEGKYGYWDAAGREPTNTVAAPDAPFVAFPTYTEEKDDYAPGISCATPIAASLVGLVVSQYPKLGTEAPGEYFEAVRSLLVDNANPGLVGFDGFSPECGFGFIDAEKTVLAAAKLREARGRPRPGSGGDPALGIRDSKIKSSPLEAGKGEGWSIAPEAVRSGPAFLSARFTEALRVASGLGIKIAVITANKKTGANMISILAACAPRAKVRIYGIGDDDDTLYRFRPGARLAEVISKASTGGNRIILTDAVLECEDPLLVAACQDAYERNVAVLAPVGSTWAGRAHLAYAFPGHLPSVIAVASGRTSPANNPVLLETSPPSVFAQVAAPAALGEKTAPQPAYAVSFCGGLVALIMEKLPLGAGDLPGQYIMRIKDILRLSSNPGVLKSGGFNLRSGYGWLDAGKAVTTGLADYIKKRDLIDGDFQKRMERRIQMEKEQLEKEKKS